MPNLTRHTRHRWRPARVQIWFSLEMDGELGAELNRAIWDGTRTLEWQVGEQPPVSRHAKAHHVRILSSGVVILHVVEDMPESAVIPI